ncbi:hypothetical protein evm_012932 [Chilo suppressalis]|nr:hypothetical protein evm_012932 [Chilo suppressalis]
METAAETWAIKVEAKDIPHRKPKSPDRSSTKHRSRSTSRKKKSKKRANSPSLHSIGQAMSTHCCAISEISKSQMALISTSNSLPILREYPNRLMAEWGGTCPQPRRSGPILRQGSYAVCSHWIGDQPF